MLRSLEARLDPRWTALLVVDMQNDYLHTDGAVGRLGLDLSGVVEMVPRLLELISAARRAQVPVIYTRNWHSETTDSEAWLERSLRRSTAPISRPGQAGTWGADWFAVAPTVEELVIDKFRYDAFLGTRLEIALRARGIRTVVLCGTATNVCVDSTLRAAHMRDFYVVLAEDCCSSTDPELHRATVRNVEGHFGDVARLADIQGHWSAR